MPLDFSGKIAAVTGGANGIGLATARPLASGGARVWILVLDGDHPAEAALEFGAHGLAADVTDRASLGRALERIGAPPDIVVANAGIVIEQPFPEYTRENWDRTIAVNL